MKIADEISYEISYRSHMSEIRIMNSYENYMRSHMRSLLVLITISYEISYNILTWVHTCSLSVAKHVAKWMLLLSLFVSGRI